MVFTLYWLQIFVFEDAVLLLKGYYSHAEFSLWHIPPLQPVLPNRRPLSSWREIFLLRSPNQSYHISPQSAWFRSYPDDTHHIDVLGVASNGYPGVARYVLKHINRKRDPDLPPFIPLLALQFLPDTELSGLGENWAGGFDSTRLWDDSVLLLWTEDQTLVANLSQLSRHSPVSSAHSRVVRSPTLEDIKDYYDKPWFSGKSVSIFLLDKINQDSSSSSIAHCPMSGRLCVLSSNGIHVMDYLVPPT
jgi:hypothetical protein